jgi:hypothetical protein
MNRTHTKICYTVQDTPEPLTRQLIEMIDSSRPLIAHTLLMIGQLSAPEDKRATAAIRILTPNKRGNFTVSLHLMPQPKTGRTLFTLTRNRNNSSDEELIGYVDLPPYDCVKPEEMRFNLDDAEAIGEV